MITHNQFIYTLMCMYPAITREDHGRRFLVGMPVDGNAQTGPAVIYEWVYEDIEQPSQEEVEAHWEIVRALYEEWTAAGVDPEPNASPSPALLKGKALERINAAAQSELSGYMSTYPEFEVQTWPKQETEARAYQLDPAASTPFCDIAAARRGISKEVFIDKVLAKVDQFTQASAIVAGHRQYLEDTIARLDPVSSTFKQDLAAIVWVSPLPSGA